MTRLQPVSEQLIQKAYELYQSHPHISSPELGRIVGLAPTTLRDIFVKRWGLRFTSHVRKHKAASGIPDHIIEKGRDGDQFTTDNSFYKSLVNHVAYVSLLESENATFKEQLNQKGASNTRIAEIITKLEYELAHRD
jgi:hypothetical protein